MAAPLETGIKSKVVLAKNAAEAPCLQGGGCKPGGPSGPRASRALPVSRLADSIGAYGTAAWQRPQDVQVQTAPSACASAGAGRGLVALSHALQRRAGAAQDVVGTRPGQACQ